MKNNPLVQKNTPLKNLNTFGIEARANYLAYIQNPEELADLLAISAFKPLPKLVLGEGSNILFTQDFEGLIIKMNIKGISIIKQNDDFIWIEAGAGENWHDFVMHCVGQGYGGVENLSLIPGTVGAAPIQNIGAYGVELKDILYQVKAINLANGNKKIFSNNECEFRYRDSIFKNALKRQFAITSVTLRLAKKPQLNTEYEVLKNKLQQMAVEDLDIKTISDAVIQIRQSKLPNPKVLGNAGSFFKNPIISSLHLSDLKKEHETIPFFLQDDATVKVNAAWLIEQCGWKGKRVGEVGVYDKQALVLVNYGKGKGSDVLELAHKIQGSVKEKFDILLEPEVHLI